MSTKGSPTRAEFNRLKAECARLYTDYETLRAHLADQSKHLQTQFVRIAQMQAILDEERIANLPRTPRPLYPAPRQA